MKLEDMAFLQMLKDAGLPEPEMEFKFAPSRRFRFDFAFPQFRLAVEKEGGVYTRQAHGSVSGVLRDLEKYSLAAVMGWRVIRRVPKELATEATIEMIREAMQWVTFYKPHGPRIEVSDGKGD